MLQKKAIVLSFLVYLTTIVYSQKEGYFNQQISENIKFYVQIGDSPTPIERGKFAKAIGYSTQSISVLKNNGWYKYVIGECDNYFEANKLCESLIKNKKLKSAIVVAAKNDAYIELNKLSTSTFTPHISVSGCLNKKGIAFSVQVLATKNNTLTTARVKHAFKLSDAVYLEINDGLSCYMVGSVHQIRAATSLLQKVKDSGASNAFLIAYLDGVRVPIRSVL